MKWRPGRGLAWARQAWWIELITVVLGYFVYEVIQGSVPAHRAMAFTNGRRLHDVEQWMHIDIDGAVNHFVNRFEPLALTSGYYYDTLHYIVTPAVLLWLWVWRADVYGRWRSALVGSSLAALGVFWALPMAPPRFVVAGIRDTLVENHIFGTVASNGTPPTLVNDVAAMPSLHVGWALWCAAAVASTTTFRWRHLVYLYPLATTLVVLGTGNHYILDAAGGLAVLGVGLVLTSAPFSVKAGVESATAEADAATAEADAVWAEADAARAEADAVWAEADAVGMDAAPADSAVRDDRPRRTKRIDAQVPTTKAPTGISAR